MQKNEKNKNTSNRHVEQSETTEAIQTKNRLPHRPKILLSVRNDEAIKSCHCEEVKRPKQSRQKMDCHTDQKCYCRFAMTCSQSAFTFAELMISLAVIAVITVVLFPAISDIAPNNNRYLFKSTFKAIESTVAELTATNALPNDTNLAANQATCLCHEFAEKLNLAENKCLTAQNLVCPDGNSYTGASAGMYNTFVTANGTRWAFQYNASDGNNGNNPTLQILVDVNQNNNNKTGIIDPNPAGGNGAFNANMQIWDNSTNGIFYNNNDITQDTFMVKIDARTGRIVYMSPVAYTHLAH